MNTGNLKFKRFEPAPPLSIFVDSFMHIKNQNRNAKEFILFPDGKIDIRIKLRKSKPKEIKLFNLNQSAETFRFEGKSEYLIICFTPLGAEHLLQQYTTFSNNNTWLDIHNLSDIIDDNFINLGDFSSKYSKILTNLLPDNIDKRKIALFTSIYTSNGELSVKEISNQINWSSRQINRYFSQKFKITLKTYLTIIRFRAALNQISEGRFYPLLNFSDQAHFIKEIKKFSTFRPKELAKDKDDRFIQLFDFSDR